MFTWKVFKSPFGHFNFHVLRDGKVVAGNVGFPTRTAARNAAKDKLVELLRKSAENALEEIGL